MSLSAGTKLGPYEIQSPLGAGGMGEVYRARDTRLDRTVAIKVLPTHLSSKPDLKQRFEREARAISSLNHPNICHLYDVGSQSGTDYLVMEYLEGETLADRLQKGHLPLDHVLKIGIEVAEALNKAHRQGILHRDLKPGNIMLTKSGAKLMDFGLAKTAAGTIGVSVGTAGVPLMPSSPTNPVASLAAQPSPLTQQGVVVGTFQYMAPEVLQGKECDARGDIFSFGCVLYEMTTGHRAFEGKSQLSVLAAILEREPEPMTRLQSTAPQALENLVRACLAKDREERIQTAHDVWLELNWVAEGISKPQLPAPAVKHQRREALAWILVAALALAIIGLLWHRRQVTAALPLETSILLPKNVEVLPFDLSFSRDGSKLAFVASSPNGQALWVRSVDSLQPQLLPGTENARYPFWSPDGRRIGFFSGDRLKIVAVDGGTVISLADVSDARGGTWNQDDTIIFAPNFTAPLMQVPANGGVPVAVTELNTANGETSHRWPWALPDGRHVLLYVQGQRSTGAPSANPTDKTSGLYVLDLKTKERKFVAATDSGAVFASGYILYVRRQSLMAQPLDAEHARVTGPAVGLLQQQVAYDSDRWSAALAASPNGLLAYVESQGARFTQLQWKDRSGKVLGDLAGTGVDACPALSPDGKRVAVQETTQLGSDIWIIDLDRGTKTRLTYDGNSSGPVWSPDGKVVAYSSDRINKRLTYIKDASALGNEEAISVTNGADQNTITDWSRDGRAQIFASAMPGSRNRLFVHWLETQHKDGWLLPPAQNVGWREATFSPDGKWLAYSSDESGRWEVYVLPFPDVNSKIQISTVGGMQPRWRRDGKELFYVALDGKLVSVPLTTKFSFKAGIPQPLFVAGLVRTPAGTAQYDVSADGKRFIVSSRLPEATSQPITIVANWSSELTR